MGCIICFDDDVEIAFRCLKRRCAYEMCRDCLQDAFKDASGAAVRECPSCKTPSARNMLEALCGPGAIRHIEDELRSKVEHDVELEKQRKEKSKVSMKEHTSRANELFTALSEELCMRCPRCKFVFDEYDGCNALICANVKCKAAICAVCLEDCGSDAHPHVRSEHGDYFDKAAFHTARKQREASTFASFINKIKNEPLEVRELVKICYEKLQGGAGSTSTNASATEQFVSDTKLMLQKTVREDRLSVLSEDPGNEPIVRQYLSPRNEIPKKYKLVLKSDKGRSFGCNIILSIKKSGKWVSTNLPKKNKDGVDRTEIDESLYSESIVNARTALQWGVVAFEGSKCIYQTFPAMTDKRDDVKATANLDIRFRRVDCDGNLTGPEMNIFETGCSGRRIIGLNQNRRLMNLEEYVMKLKPESISDAIKHYIGDGLPTRLLSEMSTVPPSTFYELNAEQQTVAHPLKLLSAKEVAGPPGTGKTKTITEVIRGIMECTDYDVVILSERNAAIDAIAQKFSTDCFKPKSSAKRHAVRDYKLWGKVLAFGCEGSMGPSASEFTMDQKLR
jgi:AAA domain